MGIGQEVAQDTIELPRAASEQGGPTRLDLDDPARPPTAGLGRIFLEGRQVDLLLGFVGGPGVGRQLDDLRHQVRQLAELDLGPVEQAGPFVGGQPLAPLEQLDGSAQARQRCPQLVPRIENQLVLLAAGGVDLVTELVAGGHVGADAGQPDFTGHDRGEDDHQSPADAPGPSTGVTHSV